ncbi:coagulation factor IX-like [Planococcus citri]|uniref:coagulation factor IX-like n=1 Tax=Planococcus citri TaxID=170843 RepID=UPI0031F86C35
MKMIWKILHLIFFLFFHSFYENVNGQPTSSPSSQKICEKLNPVNVDLKCYYRGASIKCDENLLPGTKVRPTCQPLHTYTDSTPTYEEINCKEDGKWDKALFSCVPDCGRPFTNAQLLIAGGVEEKIGDSPWHVAIYNEKKVLICSGTIISPHVVVTGALCVYDGEKNAPGDANNYEVVVSKVSRDYATKDNAAQRTYKVKEIRFDEKGYEGIHSHYASDIALLILSEKITMGATVMPVCVDWSGTKNIPPTEGTPGKVSGWGLDAISKGNFSKTLKSANVPFISRINCAKFISNDGKAILTRDKFCAGSKQSPTLLQGDSGGGLVFKENNHYFIRGLVSVKILPKDPIVMFTDVNDHIDWMLMVRNEVEQDVIEKQTTIKYKNKSPQK